MSKGKYQKVPFDELVARGDCRVVKMFPKISMQYAGTPNIRVNAHLGKGRGTDYVIVTNNKVIAVWEITNWKRYTRAKKPEVMDEEKKDRYIKSLTKKVYWLKYGNSYKRFYPSPNIERHMVVSYETNIPKRFRKEFKKNDIEIIALGYTDVCHKKTKQYLGYFIQHKNGNKDLYDPNGNHLGTTGVDT